MITEISNKFDKKFLQKYSKIDIKLSIIKVIYSIVGIVLMSWMYEMILINEVKNAWKFNENLNFLPPIFIILCLFLTFLN